MAVVGERRRGCQTREVDRKTTGWVFVGVQLALLVAVLVAPSGDAWPTPGWLSTAGRILSFVGVAVGIAAALGLGTSLTPTPVPTDRGQLTTTGLYRHVRHPIYTGVLAIVAGIVIRSGSVVTLVLGLAILAFFTAKARWEEGQLLEHYPGYAAYANRTPRFVPRLTPGTEAER